MLPTIAERAAETQSMIAEEGFEALTLTADVTTEAGCKSINDEACARLGRIDVLHYNVGKSRGDAEVAELARQNWSAIMTLNLTGYYLTCKHALPAMRAQQSGVVIGISSMAAHGAHMNMTYGVSKAGMNSLTKSMAIHNARYGIRVNAIMPGLMDTPMAIDRARQVPLLRQQGTGWDVANAALFLASDDARYITESACRWTEACRRGDELSVTAGGALRCWLLVLPGVVGTEVPQVAFRVATCVQTPAEGEIVRLHGHLRARRHGFGVVGVHVRNPHEKLNRAELVIAGRGQHDHAVAEGEAGMCNAAVSVRYHEARFEAERGAQPVDRRWRVAVAERRNDGRPCLVAHHRNETPS